MSRKPPTDQQELILSALKSRPLQRKVDTDRAPAEDLQRAIKRVTVLLDDAAAPDANIGWIRWKGWQARP